MSNADGPNATYETAPAGKPRARFVSGLPVADGATNTEQTAPHNRPDAPTYVGQTAEARETVLGQTIASLA